MAEDGKDVEVVRPARGAGRPTVFTPSRAARIVNAMRQGNYLVAAAGAGGVSHDTARLWLKRGETGEMPYYRFFVAFKHAEEYAERRSVRIWQGHQWSDWKAAATFLARRWPERWGDKARVEHTGADGGPIVTVSIPEEPDRAAQVLEILMSAGALKRPEEENDDGE